MSATHPHDYSSSPQGTTPEPGAREVDLTGSEPTPTQHGDEGQGTEAAREAAGRAQQRAQEVAGEAAQEAKSLALQARDRLRVQADEQARQAGAALERMAEQLEALADGRVNEAGPLIDYTRDAAGRARQLATRMENLGVDGMARELSDYARRRPGRFLLGAAAAGLVVGRLGRNVSSSDGQGVSQGTFTAPGAAQSRPEEIVPAGGEPIGPEVHDV